mmetsp:Transcript_2392/g.8528  ORF Transcript_2392/g.8528 Transcript_2392/m.8528 type:complete len:272 (+) Transcript_2392:1083-1898(+)
MQHRDPRSRAAHERADGEDEDWDEERAADALARGPPEAEAEEVGGHPQPRALQRQQRARARAQPEHVKGEQVERPADGGEEARLQRRRQQAVDVVDRRLRGQGEERGGEQVGDDAAREHRREQHTRPGAGADGARRDDGEAREEGEDLEGGHRERDSAAHAGRPGDDRLRDDKADQSVLDADRQRQPNRSKDDRSARGGKGELHHARVRARDDRAHPRGSRFRRRLGHRRCARPAEPRPAAEPRRARPRRGDSRRRYRGELQGVRRGGEEE